MRDTISILAGMAVIALLGMGMSLADSQQDLEARIIMLKDRVIYQQMQKCPQHAQSMDCTRDATLLIQTLDQLRIDNDEMGFGQYGSEDPGVRFHLDQRFGMCMQQFEALRRKYPAR